MTLRAPTGLLKGAAGVAAAALAWQALREIGLLDTEDVPSLWTIVSETADGLREGALLEALRSTLEATGVGLALAIAAGVPVGIAIGLSEHAERTTRLLFEFVRPIPSVAFIPIAIIAFGLGFRTEILVVAFASFWLVLFNAKAGAESVDPRLLETGRMLRLGGAGRLLRITLPASLPSIATGVRLAASTALVVAISAEILLGSEGLGAYLERARLGGNADIIWAGALAAGIVGYLINVTLLGLERRVLRWSVEYRDV